VHSESSIFQKSVSVRDFRTEFRQIFPEMGNSHGIAQSMECIQRLIINSDEIFDKARKLIYGAYNEG